MGTPGTPGTRSDADRHRNDADRATSAEGIIAATITLLIYQGYSLSVAGVAAPWIAKTFKLDQQELAALFAWMSISAIGSLLLARLADRVGRRLIILASLFLAPVFAGTAAVSPHPIPFALSEIMLSALLGGSVSSAIVLLAEELPVARRAQGQAFAAFASAVGGVLAYFIIPFAIKWGYSWRWLLAPCVAGIGLVWPVARMLPRHLVPSGQEARAGDVQTSRLFDILHPLYRKRALALLACAALDTMAGTAVNGWLYFEAVSIIGLSPKSASTLVVTGMMVGMVGFPIGAWTSEHLGRVPTVAFFGGAAWLGALGLYWNPLGTLTVPMIWLMAAYCWFKVGSSIMTVGANSAATELFPTGLRTTMVGWQMITGAVFSILAQVIIAALITPLGGLEKVVRLFALLGFPSALVFGLFIDETRGLGIDVAGKEAEWKAAHHPPAVERDQASDIIR